MMIIGCDFDPSWQQVCWCETETGETGEQKLVHARGEAKQFYGQFPAPALIGVEATGYGQQPVVSGTGTGSGARGVGRGCGADSCQLCAQTEDG
jgi:hypothetical protein